jgi:hypothetical protein
MYKFLPSSSLEGVCSLILFPLFAAGVVDTGGKFAACVVDTGGNFAAGVNATIPVVHLREKFETVLIEYSGAGTGNTS